MRYRYKNHCNEIELWNTNLKSLLEKKEVEEAGFEPTTFCLASNDANH